MKGGRRENAGRKVGKLGHKLTISVRLSGEVLRFLKSQDQSAGHLVEEAVRSSGEFRRWSILEAVR